jgi:hypothetical protein
MPAEQLASVQTVQPTAGAAGSAFECRGADVAVRPAALSRLRSPRRTATPYPCLSLEYCQSALSSARMEQPASRASLRQACV